MSQHLSPERATLYDNFRPIPLLSVRYWIGRLRYRFAYAEIFEDVIALGIQRGEFVAQNCQITAAALVGMLAESLVGPLKKEHEHEHDDLIHSLTALVLRAVGFKS